MWRLPVTLKIVLSPCIAVNLMVNVAQDFNQAAKERRKWIITLSLTGLLDKGNAQAVLYVVCWSLTLGELG